VRIAVSADELTGVAGELAEALRARGHEVTLYGALAPEDRADWAWCSERAAREVSAGRAEHLATLEPR
jgi:ribose 5-phosphate isomerase B